MTRLLDLSRQSQQLIVALAISALSLASLTTAFMADPIQHNLLKSTCSRPDYGRGALNSFGNNYLDSMNTPSDNAGGQSLSPTPVAIAGNSGFSNTRVPVIAGNWKLNPSTVQEASTLLSLLASNFLHHRNGEATEVVVFPPFPYIERAISLLEGTGIKVGAQNVGVETKGAFTGEVSPSMVRSLGCDYVMVGHSERRTLFGESDDTINAKIKLSLAEEGLKVILCVGETLEEYENDLLASVVNYQIKKALKGVTKDDIVDTLAFVPSTRLVIAYEPVWAIGTGKVATPEQAQIAHAVVRDTLQELYGSDLAGKIQIQYGGSVTPDSISDLISMPDVDGALVGGASLTADGFTRIVDGATA